MSVSAESDVHRLVFGVWMSVSGESDSWADVFGSCLSVSAESDTCELGNGGLGGLGCGLGGHSCGVGVQRFDGTVDHFVDAAFDGDFHAVLFGDKRLKNGELAW